MRERYFITGLIAAVLLLPACKKEYIPVIEKESGNFLVVSGLINASDNSVTKIILSHTVSLGDTVLFQPENNAAVKIESNAGNTYTLTQTGDGIYTSNTLSLNNADKYRLSIVKADGKKYASAFVDCRQTPAIDSLNWKQDDDNNAIIYVNTSDPNNSTRYYWWDFTETWQYTTPAETIYGVENNRVYVRAPDQQIHNCWSSNESTDILIGSSSLLSDDVISMQPVLEIPNKDKRLNFRYSILVRQFAMSAEAYTYWKVIKSNSEQLGTLFDQQPAQLKGNIYSVNDPDEPVIGFVNAATQTEKRMFINHEDINDWAFDPFTGYTCSVNIIPQNPADPYIYEYPDPLYVPWYFATGGILYITTKDCVDCTLKGGTNQKPSFW